MRSDIDRNSRDVPRERTSSWSRETPPECQQLLCASPCTGPSFPRFPSGWRGGGKASPFPRKYPAEWRKAWFPRLVDVTLRKGAGKSAGESLVKEGNARDYGESCRREEHDAQYCPPPNGGVSNLRHVRWGKSASNESYSRAPVLSPFCTSIGRCFFSLFGVGKLLTSPRESHFPAGRGG